MGALELFVGVLFILIIFWALTPLFGWVISYVRESSNWSSLEKAAIMFIPFLILVVAIYYFVTNRNPYMVGGGYRE